MMKKCTRYLLKESVPRRALSQFWRKDLKSRKKSHTVTTRVTNSLFLLDNKISAAETLRVTKFA